MRTTPATMWRPPPATGLPSSGREDLRGPVDTEQEVHPTGRPPNGSKSRAFTIRFKMAVQSAGRTACAQVVVSRPRHVGGAFSSGGKVPAHTAEKLLQLEARGQAVEIVTILVSWARCLPGALRAGSGPMTVAQPGRAKSTEAETSLGLGFRCMPATMAKFLKVDKPYLGNR